ncbi:uncharacterized protein LAESUDRAFT_753150 [Laetiporus sulphureus 93-53]|uniref:Uncharacterized protein n=1 Tax=Laetiporus sulphureus 93-53 TaxID=1314785 RepID=A0A165B9X3_9APHY|nr:uncharacterized protein LAESUDRAFT_753150 [Laetiporus sulphureus 93-53]KZT00587.1 hypothetical protein LAESUDRAFT_753150 [Laetiporus sulphureus 93-53]
MQPSESWKNNARKHIERMLQPVMNKARERRDVQLSLFPTDEVAQGRILKEFSDTKAFISAKAEATFRNIMASKLKIQREEHEARLDANSESPPSSTDELLYQTQSDDPDAGRRWRVHPNGVTYYWPMETPATTAQAQTRDDINSSRTKICGNLTSSQSKRDAPATWTARAATPAFLYTRPQHPPGRVTESRRSSASSSSSSISAEEITQIWYPSCSPDDKEVIVIPYRRKQHGTQQQSSQPSSNSRPNVNVRSHIAMPANDASGDKEMLGSPVDTASESSPSERGSSPSSTHEANLVPQRIITASSQARQKSPHPSSAPASHMNESPTAHPPLPPKKSTASARTKQLRGILKNGAGTAKRAPENDPVSTTYAAASRTATEHKISFEENPSVRFDAAQSRVPLVARTDSDCKSMTAKAKQHPTVRKVTVEDCDSDDDANGW